MSDGHGRRLSRVSPAGGLIREIQPASLVPLGPAHVLAGDVAEAQPRGRAVVSLLGESIGSLSVLAVIAAALVIVLAHGLAVTAPLDWPGDIDLLRDIAQAETFAAGGWGRDPFYRGERAWYNPLVPGLVALASRALDVPVHRVYVRAGAVLNLLAPLCLSVLVWRRHGARSALLATVVFLFVQGRRLPGWATATYSPWLLAGVFTHALFLATLIALDALQRGPRTHSRGATLGTGFLFGLTALGHTAPTLTLAAILATVCGVARRPARFALIAALATAVASPLAVNIVGHYHLRVLNRAPAAWTWALMETPGLASLAVRWLSVTTLLAIVGFVTLRRQRRLDLEAPWVVSAAALLAYSLAASRFGWPCPLPGFHFLLLLTSAECVLAGVGAAFLIERVAVRLGRPRAATALAVGLALTVVLAGSRDFFERPDFRMALRKAARRASPARLALVDWLRRATPPQAVVLCSEELALSVVGPAGRKVIVVAPELSNPFVDWTDRDRVRERLWRALDAGDRRAFARECERHGVGYVLLEARDLSAHPRALTLGLREVFRWGGLRVLELPAKPEFPPLPGRAGWGCRPFASISSTITWHEHAVRSRPCRARATSTSTSTSTLNSPPPPGGGIGWGAPFVGVRLRSRPFRARVTSTSTSTLNSPPPPGEGRVGGHPALAAGGPLYVH